MMMVTYAGPAPDPAAVGIGMTAGMMMANAMRDGEKPRFCPDCGTPAEETAKFCSNCGRRLQPEGSTTK